MKISWWVWYASTHYILLLFEIFAEEVRGREKSGTWVALQAAKFWRKRWDFSSLLSPHFPKMFREKKIRNKPLMIRAFLLSLKNPKCFWNIWIRNQVSCSHWLECRRASWSPEITFLSTFSSVKRKSGTFFKLREAEVVFFLSPLLPLP